MTRNEDIFKPVDCDKFYNDRYIDYKIKMLLGHREGLELYSICGEVGPNKTKIDLPNNFFESVFMSIKDGKNLRSLLQLSPGQYDKYKLVFCGVPVYFCIYLKEILLFPLPAESYEYEFVYEGLNDEIMRILR